VVCRLANFWRRWASGKRTESPLPTSTVQCNPTIPVRRGCSSRVGRGPVGALLCAALVFVSPVRACSMVLLLSYCHSDYRVNEQRCIHGRRGEGMRGRARRQRRRPLKDVSSNDDGGPRGAEPQTCTAAVCRNAFVQNQVARDGTPFYVLNNGSCCNG